MAVVGLCGMSIGRFDVTWFRSSTFAHSPPAHKKLTDHEKLQICTQPSAIAFLSWNISCPQIPDHQRILNHWVFGASLTLYFRSCSEPTIYSNWHLYLQINAKSQSFCSEKETTSPNNSKDASLKNLGEIEVQKREINHGYILLF